MPVQARIWVTLMVAFASAARAQTAQVAQVMTEAISDREALFPAPGTLWRYEGPRSLSGAGYDYGTAPYSGRVNDLAIDPSNSSILYATGATGGVWKSSDAGSHWVARSGRSAQGGLFATWPLQNATAVAVDPAHPNRIFVGTGDSRRLDHVPPFSAGIMRSFDGGLTWQQSGAGQMADFTVSRIVFDRANANVFAATGRGGVLPGGFLFRSQDGGVSWSQLGQSANWDDLALCDGDLWAAGTRRHNLDDDDPLNLGGLVVRSTDGGATWPETNLTAFLASPIPDLIRLACGHTVNGQPFVFVAIFRAGGLEILGTTNRGASWILLGDFTQFGISPWAHSAFAVTQNHVWFGDDNLFQSPIPIDSFGDMQVLGISAGRVAGPAHHDWQCVVPDPDETDAVYLCNDAGLYHYSLQQDRVVSLSGNLGVTQIFRLDVHPQNGNLVGFGAQDIGDAVSFFGRGTNASAIQSQTWAVMTGCDGRSAAFQGDATPTVYLSHSCGAVRRYDGTTITDILGDSRATDAPIAYRPDADALVYAGFASQSMEMFNPAGQTAPFVWNTTSFEQPTNEPLIAESIGVCPADDHFVFIGSAAGAPRPDGTLARGFEFSADGGNSWTFVSPNPLVLPERPIWVISPSPANCADFLLALGYEPRIRSGFPGFDPNPRLLHGTMARQADGTWALAAALTAIDGGLPPGPLYAVARDPAAPDKIWYVSGDAGVFRTDNAGASWTNAGDALGLPNTLVRDLRLSADGNTLYAGTFGRGVWSTDLHPFPGVFGVRGAVSMGSNPVGSAFVSASGGGRITRWLKNTLTRGTVPQTAPIHVDGFATMTAATASLTAAFADSASLIDPAGIPHAMARTDATGTKFALTAASAAALAGTQTNGDWKFSVTGRLVTFNGVSFRIAPSVSSGLVDFQFANGLTVIANSNGEYAMESLVQGSHTISTSALNSSAQTTVTLSSHRTDVDFNFSPVGVFTLQPRRQTAQAGLRAHLQLVYTLTEGRLWRGLGFVQLLLRDEQGTAAWIQINPAAGTFQPVGDDGVATGPALPTGSNRPLQTLFATFRLDSASITPNIPDPSSVTIALDVTFQGAVARRTLDVDVIAQQVDGIRQGPDLAGRVEVAAGGSN